MKMNELLQRIDRNILKQIIGVKRVNSISAILNNDNQYDLVSLVEAFYGDSIFDDKRIRKEIIKLLPPEEIKKLSINFCGKTYSTIEAAAIQLSTKGWSTSSDFPSVLLKKLGLELKFLPKRTQRLNTCEFVNPQSTYYPLFEYQNDVKDGIINKIESGINRFIMQMPTGAGKTRTSLEAIISYNQMYDILNNGDSFIWIAHTEELCEQAIESLKNIWFHTQSDQLRIVRYYGGFEPTEDELYGSFVFSSYQKLCSKKSEKFLTLLRESCRVVIIDEAHKATAYTYSKMIERLCSSGACLIGLTATPGRALSNKLENSELALFFNREIVTLNFKKNPIEALRDMKVLSKIEHQTIESEINFYSPEDVSNDKPEFTAKQLNLLGINPTRNRIIVEILKREIKSGNPCLVFSCSVEHSIVLAGVLNFIGIKTAYIDSTIRKSQRRKLIADFKNEEYDILINFGVLSTGFDAPRIKTVLISRPTTSIVLYSQMIGRGLRGSKMGGNEYCKIIDIKDNYSDFGPIENIYNFFDGYWN